MEDKRYVRFASIAGISKSDLPIAGDIWLEDICKSSWATREMLKLANLFVRYMQDPNPEILGFGYIDYAYGLEQNQLKDTLRLLVIYGAIDSYEADRGSVRAALRLSYLQRLRVLEVRSRFLELGAQEETDIPPWEKSEQKWTLQRVVDIAEKAMAEYEAQRYGKRSGARPRAARP